MDRKDSAAGDRHRHSTDVPPGLEAGIRALADSLGEGLVVIQESLIVFMNEKLEEVTGYPRDELMGRNLNDLLAEDFEQRRYISIRDRREKGEDIEYPSEVRFRTLSGRLLVMRNRSSMIEWEGRPATIHFLEDISRRKETDRLLRQQTEVNAILADTVGRILASPLSLDETAGTVLDSAMNLTDSISGILIVRNGDQHLVTEKRCRCDCSDCILPEMLDSVISNPDMMARSRPGRTAGSFYLNETVTERKDHADGRMLENVLRVTVQGAEPMSGQIILAGTSDPFGPWDLDVLEDVAEVLSLALVRHRAVEDLRQAKVVAEREALSRSQFMANVTHEVRSPLNGVLMMSSLLQDTDLDSEQEELLGVVMFSARTMDRLIRDLTDINQIRSGKFTVYNEEFNLRELCRQIMETHRQEARRKGLVLDYTVAHEASWYFGDRERIGQIIANLVVNAIRYTEHGGVRVEIRREEGEYWIGVSDTGPGIPEENREDIFRMFRQLNRDRDRDRDTGRPEGSGIGLALVRELTDAMDGRITVDSSPGKGSRFTVFLPDISDDSHAGVSLRTEAESAVSDIPRVLVAEDEQQNRKYLRKFLEREGYAVDEAPDGREAVSLAEAGEYSLILMDINMPGMDGLQASREIRRQDPNIPIVAVTAHLYEEDRHLLMQAGLNDIIRKPFDENILRGCLKRYLRN